MTVKTLTATEIAAALHIGTKPFKGADGKEDASRIALRTSTGNQGIEAMAALVKSTGLIPLTILGYHHEPNGTVVGNAYRWIFFDKASFDAAKGEIDLPDAPPPDAQNEVNATIGANLGARRLAAKAQIVEIAKALNLSKADLWARALEFLSEDPEDLEDFASRLEEEQAECDEGSADDADDGVTDGEEEDESAEDVVDEDNKNPHDGEPEN